MEVVVWDFQVKYTDGWCTVDTVDDVIMPWIWLMFIAKYKRFHTRKIKRKETQNVCTS